MIFIRNFSSTARLFIGSCLNNEVRVRFAPSPTGSIHFGGLRTALYNYIFARKNNGKFILRIEDTDQTRIVDGSMKELEDILDWSGLKQDENSTLGGPYGPYIQSQRLDIYKKHIDKLLKEGKAYRCFCSHSRLELLRKYQSRNREKPRYDGKCKLLTGAEIAEKLEAKDSHTIRFSLQPGVTSFSDMIFGDIDTDLVASNEGDPILMKSDKWPTYHFANIVDDHEMQISHVFRGSEWIASTAKHIQLYNAFGWKIPVFAHLPLITMMDGSKMSKRNNQSQIKSYVEKGYEALAILNLLTNMGGGIPKDKQDSMCVWDLETIVKNFDFGKVIRHPGGIDLDKLDKYNHLVLKRDWERDPGKSVDRLKELLAQKYSAIPMPNDEILHRILDCFLDGRVTTMNEIVSEENSYLWLKPQINLNSQEFGKYNWDKKLIVGRVIDILKVVDIDNKNSVISSMKDLCSSLGMEWGPFMKFLRLVLTNKSSGQPVYDIIRCLGKSKSLEYLVDVRDQIK